MEDSGDTYRSQTTYEELKLAFKIASSVRSCSQTTYEELKPQDAAGGPTTTWGSQTTYEELKPESFTNTEPLKWRSQTTYEELKLAFKIASSVRS